MPQNIAGNFPGSFILHPGQVRGVVDITAFNQDGGDCALVEHPDLMDHFFNSGAMA
jgi:hypothetical protein